MAIAFDTSQVQTTSASFSHTCTGSDRVLILLLLSGGINDATATYNGEALTKQGTGTDGGGNRITLLTLINPASGANTLAISVTTLAASITLSYTGVSALSGYSASQNTGASITKATSVAVTDSWVFSGGTSRVGPHDPTPSTGVTNDRSGASTLLGAGDSGPEAIGTVNHTWLNDGSNQNSIHGIALEPAAGAADTYSGRGVGRGIGRGIMR